jgi:hypothetical protein
MLMPGLSEMGWFMIGKGAIKISGPAHSPLMSLMLSFYLSMKHDIQVMEG